MKNGQEKLKDITGLYRELHNTVERTRNKLLLKDVVIDDGDEVLAADLARLSDLLDEISSRLNPGILPISETATVLRDTSQVAKKKRENISQYVSDFQNPTVRLVCAHPCNPVS